VATDALRLFVARWSRRATESAKQAFSVAAANVWNSLLTDIRNTDCLTTFQRHFFTAAYT